MVEEKIGSDKKHRGCLAVNCINELMATGTPLGDDLLNIYKHRRIQINNLVERAIKQKELPADTDAKTTANLILTFISGFSVFSKSGVKEADLRKMFKTFLSQIGFEIKAK